MDRGLPDMDGLEATASLREDGFLGAVVVTSGHAGPEHVAACLGAGADDVLGKPFGLADLVDRVRSSARPATVADPLITMALGFGLILLGQYLKAAMTRLTRPHGKLIRPRRDNGSTPSAGPPLTCSNDFLP